MTDVIAQGVAAKAANDAFFARLPKMGVRALDAPDLAEWVGFVGGRQPDFIHAFCNSDVDFAGVVARTQAEADLFPGVKRLWGFPLACGPQGGAPTATMAQVAAGNFDVQIGLCADIMLAQQPRGRIDVRLGWEMLNFTAWAWGIGRNPVTYPNQRTDFIAAWQRVWGIFKNKNRRFRIVWCVANGCYDYGGALVDPTNASTGSWPGDAFVDVVSVDPYLIGKDVQNALTYSGLAGQTSKPPLFAEEQIYGLAYLAEFAMSKNKLFAIDEVGVGADVDHYIYALKQLATDTSYRAEWIGWWNRNAEGQGGSATTAPFKFPCRMSDNSNNYPRVKAALLKEFYNKGSGPSVEQPHTSAFIARTNAVVTDARRVIIDGVYTAMRRQGLIPYLDWFFALCQQDNEISLLNFVGAGGFTTVTGVSPTVIGRLTGRLEATGNPLFTVDRGFQGTGNIADVVRFRSGNFTTAVNRTFAQDDAHMGALFLTAADNAGAQTYECGVASAFIGRNGGSTRWIGKPLTASTKNLTSLGKGPGSVVWNRVGPALWNSYFDGVFDQTGTDASVAPTNDDMRLCAIPSIGAAGGGINQIAVFHGGRALPVISALNGPAAMNAISRQIAAAVGAL